MPRLERFLQAPRQHPSAAQRGAQRQIGAEARCTAAISDDLVPACDDVGIRGPVRNSEPRDVPTAAQNAADHDGEEPHARGDEHHRSMPGRMADNGQEALVDQADANPSHGRQCHDDRRIFHFSFKTTRPPRLAMQTVKPRPKYQ